MNTESKKILLVSGCSYTDKDFASEYHPDFDTSWPKWPELVAEKLDMNCVNLAKMGAGNEYIYSSLLKYITENDTSNIGLVIPAWSQSNRKDYQVGNLGRWTNDRIDPNGDVFSWVRKSLDYYLSFKILCERYDLPYMQVQMLDLYQDWLNGLKPRLNDKLGFVGNGFRYSYPGDKEKDIKKIVKIIDSYEDKINGKKFIGWPLSYKFDGFSVHHKVIFGNTEARVSNLDTHPNKIGHKKIAEFIYDRLG